MFVTDFFLSLEVRHTYDGTPVWQVPVPRHLVPPVPKLAEAGAVPEVVAAIADFAELSVYTDSFPQTAQSSKPLRRLMRTLSTADEVLPLQNLLVHDASGWWWFDTDGRRRGPYDSRVEAALTWIGCALKSTPCGKSQESENE